MFKQETPQPWASVPQAILLGGLLAGALAVRLHAAQTTYEFQNSRLGTGELFDQDNWQARFGGWGASVVTGLGWNSSRGLEGGPRDSIYSRANDARFSFALAGSETEVVFDFRGRLGQGALMVGVGTGLDETAPHSEYGCEFGFQGTQPLIGRAGFGGYAYGDQGGLPAQPGDWIEAKLTVNLPANGGNGATAFAWKNLSRGMTAFVPIEFPDFPDGFDLGLLAMPSSARPRFWNTVFIRVGLGTALDRIGLPYPPVPVIAAPDRLQDGTAFSPYAQPLVVIGEGWQPFLTVRKIRGTLPSGLSLSGTSPHDTYLSGLPTEWGDYEFTVEVVGASGGGRSQRSYQLHVAEPAAPGCAPSPCGLLAWWSAEGDGRSRVPGSTAELRNGLSFDDAGKVGKAFRFDPFATPVQAAVVPRLELDPEDARPTAVTVEGWIKPLRASGCVLSQGNNSARIVYLGTEIAGVQPNLKLRFEVRGHHLYDSDSESHVVWTDPVLVPDRWIHVAATFDEADQAQRIFIDGVEVPSRPAPGTILHPIDWALASNILTPIVLGGVLNPGDAWRRELLLGGFGGLIDELAVYGLALSPDQIASIFHAGAAGKCDPPAPIALLSEVDMEEDTARSFRLDVTLPGDQPLVPDSPDVFTGSGPTYVFHPPNDANGDVTHVFRSRGCAQGARVEVSVTFHIRAVPDPLAAEPDSLTVAEDARVDFNLQANNPDRQPLTYCVTTLPQQGQLLQGDQPLSDPCGLRSGDLSYVPNPNYHGPDEIRFKVTDGSRTSEEAIIRIEVTSVPDAPGHVMLQLSTAEDECLSLPVTGVDAQDGDPLSFRYGDGWSAFDTMHGRVDRMRGTAGYGWYYCPAANFIGEDRFDFAVHDDRENLAGTGTLVVTVRPVNDAPYGVSASRLWIGEDSSGGPIQFDASDRERDPISFILKSAPVHGHFEPAVVVGSPLPNPVVYKPEANFHGFDHFTFVAFDRQDESEPVSTTIEVYSIHDNPVVRPFEVTVAEDSAANPLGIFSGNHAANGPDANGPLEFTQSRFTTQKGTAEVVSVNGLRDIVYTPNRDAFGSDSLFYSVRDVDGGRASGSVTIHIDRRDDPPVLPDFPLFTRAQGTIIPIDLPARDVDEESLSYQVTSAPRAGNTASVEGNRLVYVPAPDFLGDDQFTYSASDGHTTLSGTIRVHLVPIVDRVWLTEDVSRTADGLLNPTVRITGFGYSDLERANLGWDYQLGDDDSGRNSSEGAMTHWAWKDGTAWRVQDLDAGFRWPGGLLSQDVERLIPGIWPQFLLMAVWQFSGPEDYSHEWTWRVGMSGPTSFANPEPLEWAGDHTGSQGVREYLPGRLGEWLTWRFQHAGDRRTEWLTVNGASLFEKDTQDDFAGVGFDTDRRGPHVLHLLARQGEADHTLFYRQGQPGSGPGRALAVVQRWGSEYLQYPNRVDLTVGVGDQLHAVVRGSTVPGSPMAWGPGHLHYLTCMDGATWTETSLDASESIQVAAIAVDPSGRPAVAYIRDRSQIRFAMLLNGQWHNDLVRPIDWRPGENLELAFDPQGMPAIGFYDRCARAVRVARPLGDPNMPVDLAISTTPASLDVTADETAQTVITVVNTAPRVATQVSVTVTLPEYLTFVSSTPPPTSIAGQTLHYEVGALASCQATIRVNVQATQPGSFDVAAAAGSAERDSTPSNNETHCHIESGEGPRPEFAPGVSPPGGVAGLDYSFQLTATSLNGACSFGVSEGALPAGLLLSRDGFLRGRPVLADTNGVSTHTFSVRATDPAGRTATALVTLRVQGFTGLAYTWTGAADSNWSNPANWSPRGVPGAHDTATLANGTTVTLPGDIRLLELSLQNATLIGSATFSGNLLWTGGAMIDANLTLAAGSVLRLAGGADRVMIRTVLRNQGTVEWEGGTLTLNSSSIENAGRWDVRGDVALVQQNDCSFANSGLYLRNAGSGTHTVALTSFISTGQIEARAGTLAFPVGNVVSRGANNHVSAALEAQVNFAGDNRFEATVFDGPGPKVLNAGSFSWAGTMRLENVTFAGGVLTGTAVIEGSLPWTGGELIDLDLTILAGHTLHLAGGADRRLVRSILRNRGAVAWDGGTLTLNSSTVENANLWEVRGDLALVQQNDCAFLNTGRYLRSAGTGSHTIALTTFSNSTTVECRTGGLSFPVGNVLSRGESNRFLVDDGARLDFAGNNRFEATAFEGSGPKVFNAGSFAWINTRTLENVTFAGGVLTGTVTLGGPLRWTGGELIDLDLTVPPGLELHLAGGADRRLVRTALRNHGAIIWEGGTLTFNSSHVENYGLWDVQGDLHLAQQNDCSFVNLGHYVRSRGPGTHTIALTAFHTGTQVVVLTGTLAFPAGNVLSRLEGNRFVIAEGARVDFAGNNYFEGTSFEGPGLKVLSAGSFSWLGTMSLENVTFAGGVLTGQAVLDGPLHWTGGEFIDLDLTVPVGETLRLAGGADRRLVRTALHNQGAVEWHGGTLTLNSSTIENLGLWEVQADVALVQQNDCAFLNTGRYLRSGGSGSHTIALTTFNNSTAVENRTGNLLFPSGNVVSRGETNRFTMATDTRLDFAGNNFFEATHFEGPGLTVFNSGSFRWVGTMGLRNATLAGGVLTGNATLNGPLRWTGGELIDLDLTVPAGQTLQLAGDADRRLVRTALHNQGTVEWQGGTLTLNSSTVENRGLWEVQADVALVQQNDCAFLNNGRYLRSGGSGTHTVALSQFAQNGTLDLQQGIAALQAGYSLAPTAVLRFGFGGLAPGAGYAQLQFSGAVSLAGKLEVELRNGFVPAKGNVFTPIIFGSSIGTLSGVGDPAGMPGSLFKALYEPAQLRLLAEWATPLSLGALGIAGGAFEFAITGTPGQSFAVETSTNLTAWGVLTNLTLQAPVESFFQPGAGSEPQRFFRLRPTP